MRNALFILCWSLLLFGSCQERASQAVDCLSADVRSEIDREGQVPLGEEILSAHYIPLQITADDASLIDGIADYAVSRSFIYILPIQEPRIVLFDREGNFIRTLIREGQGPGEFSGLLSGIQVDEANDRLYLFGSRIWEYTLSGEFVRQLDLGDTLLLLGRKIAPDRIAGVALPYMPFAERSFGLGVFSEKGEMFFHKNDFYSPLVPKEKTGFTVHLAASPSADGRSLLFKAGSNDTVFRIQADTVVAACVLNLKNSDEEIIRSLDITDFSDMAGERRRATEIFVQDIMETERRFYFRCRYRDGFRIVSVDKQDGSIGVEVCRQPAPLKELAKTTLQHGLLGSRSWGGFPVWGRVQGKELVQVVGADELVMYAGSGLITVPEALRDVGESDNPVLVVYQLK